MPFANINVDIVSYYGTSKNGTDNVVLIFKITFTLADRKENQDCSTEVVKYILLKYTCLL
jgi:hypothetical protein